MMLEARALRLALPDRVKSLFGRPRRIEILKGIDVALARGQSLGIVGESGSGKTSLGRTLLRLHEPTGGSLSFDGTDITHMGEAALRPLRARMQMIFQDPQSSLNPRHRIGTIVAQPLFAFGRLAGRRDGRRAAAGLLERVGLPAAFVERYPHELSGGQQQRVGIARAIALEPALVVADEIVSGLDVSTQAQILALLAELKRDLGLALVFISHDLSVVRVICDDVLVMHGGEVVERGRCADLFARPRHGYTRALLDAIPLPEVDTGWLDDDNEAAPATPATEGRAKPMQINGSVAFVTGTNRGIGRAVVTALAAAGAAKVYAAARDPAGISDLAADHAGVVEPLALDITDHAAVAAAAARCGDVTLVINNAGVNQNAPLSAANAIDNARAELEVNYLGTLVMCRAFAPVLKANGGGAIVNMLTILARVNLPALGSYCASKAAAFSMTQGVRAELAGQGTLVVGVMPGAVDTDMSRDFPLPKLPPAEVAKAALAAVEGGLEDTYPGDMATGVAAGLADDAKKVEKEFAQYLPQSP